MGQARDLVEQFYERFGAGDLDGAVALASADCTHMGPAGPQDNDAWRLYGETFRTALPDAHMEIVSAIEEGDTIAIQGRFRGTHSGPLVSPQGEIPASGNAIDMPYADFFRVKDGKLADHNVYWDQVTMLAQIGAAQPA